MSHGGTCLCSTNDRNPWGGRHAVPGGSLGSLANLCGAFFHAKTCFEWGNPLICVTPRDQWPCVRFVVVAVARLQDSCGHTRRMVRYTNCWRGDSQHNLHAEDFVVRDTPYWQRAWQPGDTLTLYMTYQPCHYSSGGRRTSHRQHGKSCSVLLSQWAQSTLAPAGVTLRIRCAGIYRANWTTPALFKTPADAQVFHERVTLARDGIRLVAPYLRAMTWESWRFLMSYCHPQLHPDTAVHPIVQGQRRHFDQQLDEFLLQFQEQEQPPCPPATGVPTATGGTQ